MKSARKSARSLERQLPAVDPNDRSKTEEEIRKNWRIILQSGQAVLEDESKDLEVAAWLIEALVRDRGFPGLRDGVRLATGLIEQYWDEMYPSRDEEVGYLFRVAALRALNGEDTVGTLIAPIQKAPLIAASEDKTFSYSDFQFARQIEQIEDPERRARQIERGVLTIEQLEQVATQAGEQALAEQLQHVRACLKEVDRLDDLLQKKCEESSGSQPLNLQFGQIRETLRDCEQSILRFYSEPTPVEEGSMDGDLEAGNESGSVSGNAAPAMAAPSETMTRDQAFQVLLRIADFFRRTEPHSPIPYALEQVVRWGRMPAPKLWTELIGDETEREKIFRLLGMPEENKIEDE